MEALIQTIKRLHDVHCLLGCMTSANENGDHNNNNNNIYNNDFEHQPMALGHWLPQIVVLGALGVGKSSIIESLVGRRFLPKGTVAVPGAPTTRRPLVVQFVFCTKKELSRMAAETGNQKLEAWGVFQHKPEQKFYRFDDIKQEIQQETNHVAGDKHGISPDPIHLKIYSSSVNFTIVDLPGLIETPLRDQPFETANKIKNIILNYISVPNSIILTVVAANTDYRNDESLKLALQVDPEGLRTLLVVTKLDLVDSGVNATELLTGKILKIRLGIVGVVNMPSKGHKLTIAQAIDEEESFFKYNYPKIATQHGVASLSKVLQNLLLENIRLTTPDLRRRILQKVSQLQTVLESYGSPILDKGQTLLQLINDFASNYCSLIVGNFHDLDTGELCCGARIAYIFQESFGNALNAIDPLAGLTKVAMLTAIRNASGTRPGLFVPEVSFELLVKKQIAKLEEPSIRCADLVHEELENLVKVRAQNCNPLLKRFPALHKRIKDGCLEIIRVQLPITQHMIRQTVAIQLAYINTNHPDFLREVQGVQNPAGTSSCRMQESVTSLGVSWEDQQESANRTGRLQEASRSQSHELLKPSNSLTKFTNAQDRESHDSLVIEHLINTYFNIVRKTVQDSVPKIIMHSMVNHLTDNLQRLLVSQLYSPDLIKDLLTESEEVTKFRKEVEERISCLKMAADILQSLKDPEALREERSKILVL